MLQLSLAAGTTARRLWSFPESISMFPEIDLSQNKLGIFGKLVKSDTISA